MQIEAIYQDGRLEFTRPIHFKAGPVRLLIEVSPDALAETAGAVPQADADHHAPQTPSEPHALNLHALPSDVVARLEQRRAIRAEILGRPFTSEPDSLLTEEQQSRDRAFSQREAEMAASVPAEANRWLIRLETLRAEAIVGQREQPGTLSDEQLERLNAFEMREDH